VLVLDTHDTTSPDSAEFFVIVVLVLELFAHGIKIRNILLAEFSDSDASGSLHVAEFAKGSLSADEAVGDTLLSAESWEVDNHLDWISVMSNDNKLSSVLFNEGGNVVKTEFEVNWLGSLSTLTFSFFLQAIFFLSSGLWAVFREQFEELGGLILLNSLGELVDGGGHLESLHEDSLLSLDSDVFWPFDETGEVSLWLNITSESEVLGSLLEERAGTNVSAGSWGTWLSLNDLLSLSCFLNLHQNRDR